MKLTIKKSIALVLLAYCFPQDFVSAEADSKTNVKKPPELKDLPKFNAVELDGIGDLYITQSNDEGLKIEAPEDLLSLIKVSVSGKVLYLNLSDSGNHTRAKIKYHLSIKNLQKIISNSTSTIFIEQPFKTEALDLALGSLGEAYIKMAVKSLRVRIDSGSKLVASGTAAEQVVVINGAGEFNGVKLLGQNLDLKVSGSGLAKTGVAGDLTVKASDNAIVKYCGNPTLTKRTSEHGFVAPGSKVDCQ